MLNTICGITHISIYRPTTLEQSIKIVFSGLKVKSVGKIPGFSQKTLVAWKPSLVS